ncbi:phospholipase D-like domain-containing protein [Nostoc sp. XA010]|nr:phospholipase D-like domain-containing protein [Nostoc sp. XA010]
MSDVEAWLGAFQGKVREDIFNFIIDNKYNIHHYRNLHAKVILGDNLCLVGSANLTAMGITQRLEMSILLDENNHINEIREWFEHSWSSSGEINIPELKDYIKKNTTITPRLEEQNSYLNSDAPIIKSKILPEPKNLKKKASKSNAKESDEVWNGRDFYVNIGEGRHRNWDDCRKYGFISAGSEKKHSRHLERLLSGSRIFVYIPKKIGYVGVGLVTDTAVRVKDFTVLFNGQQVPILDVPLVAPKMDEYADDLDKSEYLVRIEWIKTVPKSQAYWEKDLFANPNIVCEMKSIESRLTIEKLSQYFGLND